MPATLPALAALAGAALCVLVGLAWFFRRAARRAREVEARERAPIPPAWEAVLRRRMPVYPDLPDDVRRRLHRWMKIFLDEKHFTACGGLARVTDSMAVSIAGHACLLLAGRSGGGCFPGVKSILVYPDWFYSRTRHGDPGSGMEIVAVEARVGEASPFGSVVLSWREALQATAFAGNGKNVIVHEFAHHLAPAGPALLAQLEKTFRALASAPDADPVLDAYGSENRDEFWAVSTEAFLDAPARLRAAHPDWYAALSAFFALDPAGWRHAREAGDAPPP
jgi:Mlc titration factor MtfA (ptsG expression regulator)